MVKKAKLKRRIRSLERSLVLSPRPGTFRYLRLRVDVPGGPDEILKPFMNDGSEMKMDLPAMGFVVTRKLDG